MQLKAVVSTETKLIDSGHRGDQANGYSKHMFSKHNSLNKKLS